MSNHNEQAQIEFRNKANAVFSSICHCFETAASNVSRRNEEYTFQRLKKQYAATLEADLQAAAKQVLQKFRNEHQVKELDRMFHQFIKDYLHRFVQKINDL